MAGWLSSFSLREYKKAGWSRIPNEEFGIFLFQRIEFWRVKESKKTNEKIDIDVK
jgi:hypothetical protein